MYYKLISGSEIVDAGENPAYVRRQAKNGLWLSCPADIATGIISSDGATVYALEEMDGYIAVTVEEISEDECAGLREELEANGVINALTADESTASTEAETLDAPANVTAVAKSALQLQVEDLTAEVEALKAKNTELAECLLEMSMIVYS